MAFLDSLCNGARRAFVAIAVMASILVGLPASANADAGSFLRSLEGDWRGDGLYRFEGRTTDERISCRLTSAFDAAADRLDVTGACAVAQVKSPVKGYLSGDGNNVSGALLGELDGSRMTKSSGSVEGNRLVVLASFVDNATNTLYRSQQIIRRTRNGFEAEFYWYDNKLAKFTKSGSIEFVSR